MSVLVFNAGSSSLKFGVYDASDPHEPAALVRGQIAGIGHALKASAKGPDADALDLSDPPDANAEPPAVFAWLMARIAAHPRAQAPAAVGHRIVHGGRRFAEPVRLDQDVIAELERLSPLAPQHQPFNLLGERLAADRWPGVTQVGCFDTAFHRTLDPLEETFALPRRLTEAGVQRYGFHGLSYAYVAERLPTVLGERADGRVIVAHLGAGASLCAMNGRKSVATTMGFTALDGLMMATRCGALDPGVVLHLIQEEGLAPDAVATLLYADSGLLGVSGLSPAMEVLLASDDPRAKEAVDLFVHRIIGAIGQLAARLEGLDALVFTAGIGEHAAPIREAVAKGCAWLGARVDAAANTAHAERFETAQSTVALAVVPTDEEAMIAADAARLALTAAA